ncbi:MAG: ABC transporter permease [Chloroflexota bacterium]
MTSNDKSKKDNRTASQIKIIWQAVSVPIASVLLAIIIGSILVILSGANPIEAYAGLLKGSFGDFSKFGRTLEKATPLILSGLAVSFAFKAGLFNIGAQGQLIFGAITAAAIGFGVEGLPVFIHLPLALFGGALAGALFGAIPGVLKTSTGAHEVITTIMLNFIALNITDYLADGPWKDNSPGNIIARTPKILETAAIPRIAGLPLGFLIAVLLAILIWWLLTKTTLGFEIRTAGLNPHAAKYAGIKVGRTIVLTMIISGLLAGTGGAIETLGIVGRYQPGFNVGLGFDGITVALLAKTHPIGNIFAALLIGAMKAGASQMQFSAGVPHEIIDVIQSLILFFVAAELVIRRLIGMRATGDEGVRLTSGWGKQD